MDMTLAKVVATRPGNKVDLLFLAGGRRVPGVRVICSMASSSSGQFGLPAPDAQKAADPYAAPARSDRDLIACVGFFGTTPVVLGFLFPEVSEMIFKDADRYMNRTPSDFYHTVDGLGNAEWFHPSGAYIRMATSPEHEDLKGKDLNGTFDPKRNADKKVHFHIQQAGNTASIDIDPAGNIAVKTAANLSAEVAGTVSVHSAGATTVTADGGATVKAPNVLIDTPDAHCTGKLTVDGLFTYKAGLSGTGGGTISGDVKIDGISFDGHVHSDPQGGKTSPPS